MRIISSRSQFYLILFTIMCLVLAACGQAAEEDNTGTEGGTTPPSEVTEPAGGAAGEATEPAAEETATEPSAATPEPAAEETATEPSEATPSGSPVVSGTPAANCPDTGEELLIYSSMPMTGSSRGQTVSIVNGMRLALEEHGGKAGGYTIRYEPLDDATAAAGKWTPEAEAANARKAVTDGATVYLGTFNSGAAAVSIPILNEAGIPMISPANTAINLTLPGDPDPGLFDTLYTAGPRNYFRVVPNDRIQGAAAANWAKDLGATTVFILHDQEVYGEGLAQVFRSKAEEIGLQVAGFEGIDPRAGSYAALMQRIVNSGADLVFFGGLTQTGGPQLLKDLRDQVSDPEEVKFVGPDGILESAFIEGAGPDVAEGTYGTVAAAPPSTLTGSGAAFYENYRQTYNAEPEPYAIFGYDSMLAALLAIDKACSKDPRDVLEALNNLGEVNGALGTWSFDENGDTTLSTMHGYRVQNGEWVWVKELSAE